MIKLNSFDKPMHVLVDQAIENLPSCFEDDCMKHYISSISRNLISCKTSGLEFRLLPFQRAIDIHAFYRDFYSLSDDEKVKLFDQNYYQDLLQEHYCILSSILESNNIIFEFDIDSSQRLKPCFFLDFVKGLSAPQLNHLLSASAHRGEESFYQSLPILTNALDKLINIEPSIHVTSIGYMLRRHQHPIYRLNIYHPCIDVIKQIALHLGFCDLKNLDIIDPFPFPVLALDLISAKVMTLSGIELKPNIRWSDILKRAVYNQILHQFRIQLDDKDFPCKLLNWIDCLPCSRLERRIDQCQYISHLKISVKRGEMYELKLYTRIDSY